MKHWLLPIGHFFRAAYCFVRQLLLLVWEVPVVFFYMFVLSKRRLDPDHPWVTGETSDGESIWPKNIVYRSPSRFGRTSEASDAEIVTSIGRFLASMVARSAATPEIPRGPKRRMPHGVNYIHGSVHYNGAFLMFDDFADLVSHLSDRRFRRDLMRFARNERREVTFVFRNRKYDPTDFAYLVGSVRSHLPWFSNGNGPTKRPVLWGNMSPYPAVATINGAWIGDLFGLWRGRVDEIARPAIDSRDHFDSRYFGRRREFSFGDRLQAYWMFTDVRSRGFRGQLFFSNRRDLEPQRIGEYRDAGGYWEWTACYEVPPPRLETRKRRGIAVEDLRLSVVVPTLDEADEIEDCIAAIRHGLQPDEIIVVDGGSSDDTVAVAEAAGARVVTEATAGRGAQCRIGAQIASGNVLTFLHADTRPDADARVSLEEMLCDAGEPIAMFKQRSKSLRRRYRWLDWITAVDSIFTRFGDQGIIVTRELYDEIGGMPGFRLFEDVEFLRRARRRAPIPRIDAKLDVSPRRFERNGILAQLFHDAVLVARYLAGVIPSALYASYYAEATQ